MQPVRERPRLARGDRHHVLEDGKERRVRLLGDRPRLARVAQRNNRAAEAASREAGAQGAGGLRSFHERVDLRRRDLEALALRDVGAADEEGGSVTRSDHRCNRGVISR